VFKNLKNFLDEIASYMWKEREGAIKDEPVKEHDHLMDALRYLGGGVAHRTEVKVRWL